MSLQFELDGQYNNSRAEVNIDVFPDGMSWVAYETPKCGNNGVEYEARCIDEGSKAFASKFDAQKDVLEWFERREIILEERHEKELEANKYADNHDRNRGDL